MNKVILTGRLTKDPELKHTNSGLAFCGFTLAVNRTYTKDGEKQADFINCMVWRTAAENLAKYQAKGGLIAVEGELQTRTYDDKNGVKHYITEVVCSSVEYLSKKTESHQVAQEEANPYSYMEKTDKQDITSQYTITNEDLPF